MIHRGPPTRFPMTAGPVMKFNRALFAAFVGVPLVGVVVATRSLCAFLLVALWAVLVAAMARIPFAPQAVSLSTTHLRVERLGWSDFEVPLRELTSFSTGPAFGLFEALFQGNRGLGASLTGVFLVEGAGLARAWVARLGVRTVIVHRDNGLPLVLGVDAPGELEAALLAAGIPRQNTR
ncbi:MAG: hypothetical protein U0228_38805 [Myxococcaceae bacterium]